MRITINGEPRDVPTGATLATLATLAAERPAAGTAVALNGAVVRAVEWPATPLTEQDRVEIVTPMQGG